MTDLLKWAADLTDARFVVGITVICAIHLVRIIAMVPYAITELILRQNEHDQFKFWSFFY